MKDQLKKKDKELKRKNKNSGGGSKKKKVTFTEDELEEKLKEAKVQGAQSFRNQAMVALPGTDVPEVLPTCLIAWQRLYQITQSEPDFWLSGLRVGIDTDSSVNVYESWLW